MPLTQKTILITRTKEQAISLNELLVMQGWKVINVPTIKISDPEDPERLQQVLKSASAFEWIIFTSSNAVRYFFKSKIQDDEEFNKVKIACVGKKTGEVLNTFGFEPHLVPTIFSNQNLLEEIKKFNLRGKHILLPVSNLAGDELERGLKALGAHVKRLEVYKNTLNRDPEWDNVYDKITHNVINCVTFYSPSALNAFVQLMGKEGLDRLKENKIPIAVIGSSTAQAARENNLYPEIIPTISDDEHLVEALKNYFGVLGS